MSCDVTYGIESIEKVSRLMWCNAWNRKQRKNEQMLQGMKSGVANCGRINCSDESYIKLSSSGDKWGFEVFRGQCLVRSNAASAWLNKCWNYVTVVASSFTQCYKFLIGQFLVEVTFNRVTETWYEACSGFNGSRFIFHKWSNCSGSVFVVDQATVVTCKNGNKYCI